MLLFVFQVFMIAILVHGSLGCGSSKFEFRIRSGYRSLGERQVIYITFKDFVKYVNFSFDKPNNCYSMVSWG